MRLPRLAGIATIAGVVVLSACSGRSPGGPSTRASTTTAATTAATTSIPAAATTTVPRSVPVSALGGPKILDLSGPPTPVPCNAPTSVELHWETQGATSVTLRIDLDPIFATYRAGAEDQLIPLACDGTAHVYTLTARAADGRTATRALTITERKR